MEHLKGKVQQLLTDRKETTLYLQQLNEALLTTYEMRFNDYLTIAPLEVEIYYVNQTIQPYFIDTNMQCISTQTMRVDNEIWKWQAGRFGQLYFHLRGRGGIDICLSDSNDYALCATIKSAIINGEKYWGQACVYKRFMEIIATHEQITEKAEVADLINTLPTDKQKLVRRETPHTDCVYHIKRKVRRTDKNYALPLHSFMDVWEKKLSFTNVQRVNIYMSQHLDEDVLNVMRQHDFHNIPLEVRIKYGISPKTHI